MRTLIDQLLIAGSFIFLVFIVFPFGLRYWMDYLEWLFQ